MTEIRSFATSHSGAKRSYNEDAHVERPDIGLWAVADGAGGHQSGDVASGMIREALSSIPAGLNAAQLLAEARARIAAVHDDLLDEAEKRGPDVVMASTVVVLLARGGHYAALWAGDSRIYLLRAGALRQITKDHSLVQELVDAGEIPAEKAEQHPQANIITRAVGAGEEALILDKAVGELLPGDRFLLCSDGLSKCLPDEETAALLGAPDGVAPTEMLVGAALARMASDNVTAVVVEVR